MATHVLLGLWGEKISDRAHGGSQFSPVARGSGDRYMYFNHTWAINSGCQPYLGPFHDAQRGGERQGHSSTAFAGGGRESESESESESMASNQRSSLAEKKTQKKQRHTACPFLFWPKRPTTKRSRGFGCSSGAEHTPTIKNATAAAAAGGSVGEVMGTKRRD